MKSIGMVRKLDELGRITLPIELRRTIGIEERDPLEIYVEEDRIVLEKYNPNKNTCQCGCKENLTYIGSVAICLDCLENKLNEVKAKKQE